MGRHRTFPILRKGVVPVMSRVVAEVVKERMLYVRAHLHIHGARFLLITPLTHLFCVRGPAGGQPIKPCHPGTDNPGPPAQEQPMKEITQELPDRIPDPRAEPVRAKKVAGGKAGLITPHNKETG